MKEKVFVFIDGPHSKSDIEKVIEVNEVAKSYSTDFEVVASVENRGLSASIFAGIDHVLTSFDRIIVLEDDLVVARNFLNYCNNGLEIYAHDVRIASIQGFTPDVKNMKDEIYFLRGADCWGWATWKDRWSAIERDSKKLLSEIEQKGLQKSFDLDGAYPYTKMLQRQALGQVDSWAIRWHASMFLQDRLSVYPSDTLIENMGQDGSGTHQRASFFVPRILSDFLPEFTVDYVEENIKIRKQLKKFLRKKYGTYSVLSPHKYIKYAKKLISRAFK